MRVAIDTNGLYTNQAGIARQIRGLVKGLKKAAGPDIELCELAWEVENFSYRQPARAFKTLYRELIWANFQAPLALTQLSADLLHSTAGHLIEPPRNVKHVFTFHDMAILRHPERYRTWQRWRARLFPRGRGRVDRYICISQFTADEVIKLTEIPASQIEVIYNGCDFHPDEPPAVEVKPEFTVPDEFFLFVGSLEPGKNLVLLKEMYALAERQEIKLPPLLIIGARWAGVPDEGTPPANWHYLGRQSDAVLVYLYRRAQALLFPSKYEGFGLPVVEAMALGCPAICSPVASLPEVGAEAALFCEMSAAAYLKAAQRLLQEQGLRADLVGRGYQRAQQFSWRKCGEQTLGVYRKVLN